MGTSAKVRIPEPSPEPRSSPWRCSWWWPTWRTWCRSWRTSQDVNRPLVISEIATSILVIWECPQDGYNAGDVSLVKIHPVSEKKKKKKKKKKKNHQNNIVDCFRKPEFDDAPE